MENKKGNITVIIVFFALMFLALIVGFIMVTGSATLNYVWDETVPELVNIGAIESQNETNFTEYAGYTISPANSVVQSFTWATGVLYMMMLVGILGMVVMMRGNTSMWLIGFFLLCVILLIMGSILMSNIYEDFYDDTGELGDRLKEHTLLSFMILHSPVIFTIISFIAGIILFSGMGQEEFV